MSMPNKGFDSDNCGCGCKTGSLKERWIKALKNPLYWIAWGVIALLITLSVVTADGAPPVKPGAMSTVITVQNTTDKDAWIQVMYHNSKNPETLHIAPNSSRNMAIRFGEHVLCVAVERDDVYRCSTHTITPDVMYDADGNKLYLEISE